MDGKFWGKIGICTVILGLGMFAVNTLTHTPNAVSLLRPPIQPSSSASELLKDVTLAGSEMAVQETGHMARAAFAINNQSSHDINNVKIICTLLNSSGGEQGRSTWVLPDTIKAHSNGIFSSTASMYVSDRATATQCQIVDLDKVSAPLIAIHRATHSEHGEAGHGAPEGHGGEHH